MVAVAAEPPFDISKPLDLASQDFADRRYEWYRWLLEEAPVCRGKISVMKVDLVARYEDCRTVLRDPRFMRNRGRARGKAAAGPLPFPLPKSIAAIATSMIVQDDPEHRRLRNLVNKAFTPRAVGALEHRVESLSHELLDRCEKKSRIDLIEDYARPIPSRVIAEMLGIPKRDMAPFEQGMQVLTRGFSGLAIVRTLLWDLRNTSRMVRDVIAHKRASPADDILSALIAAEEGGDRLSEDELLAMVFLLIIAGFETTQHLIGNSVRTLLEHPEALERLRAEPALWDTAVEELVRFRGPVHGTKMQWATEDVTLHGYTIKRGSPVMPMIAAGNMDPRAFDEPERFDITRHPNPHLGFGFGEHFCLGAQLARMETRVALKNLIERHPKLRLAVPPRELRIVNFPGWYRHAALPVELG